MKTLTNTIAPLALVAFASTLAAAEPAKPAPVVIPMSFVDAAEAPRPAGTVSATDTGYGLVLKPMLNGLPPGIHGFHVHENPSCDPADKEGQAVAGLAAGGHYDPAETSRHEGPYGQGHLGDLPALYVGPDGKADYPVLAPRLKVSDLQGRSLMVHAGGDNHSDHPAPLGGGGPRIVCGITPDAPRP